MGFWQHCKNCVATASRKCTKYGIEKGVAVLGSRALRGVYGYSFFTAQNKLAVEIRREMCSHHCYIICIGVILGKA